MRKVHYVANSQFRHIFFRHALVYEYSDRSPTRALDQATATQSPRCPASVCLQDSKNRENLQINRTATVQQYRYSSIEQFSSISTAYSSTIHPRANSPTLNPFSTIGVKSGSSRIRCQQSEFQPQKRKPRTDYYVWHFGTQQKIL